MAAIPLPRGAAYDDWLAAGRECARYEPVHRLVDVLERKGPAHFLRGVIHGSVGTLDDNEGFSDLDLAFVIRRSSVLCAERLLDLRDLARDIVWLALRFDPYMHHGPHFVTEIDLEHYPAPMFPPTLFSYAVDVMPAEVQLEVRPFHSKSWTVSLIRVFEDFFHKRRAMIPTIRDRFDIEWVVGNTLILPSLFLQALTGTYRYKRDTFGPASEFFDADTWRPIVIASQVRANLPPRPMPPDLLFEMCRRIAWAEGLRRWERNSRTGRELAAAVNRKLGADFCSGVLNLISQIRVQLNEQPGGA